MTGGWLQGCGDDTGAWQRTAAAFTAAVESGRLDLPLPGAGVTWERWAVFADLAEEDLSLARLGEGHADAVAILAEIDADPDDRRGDGAMRALRVRALTEAAATDVLAGTGRALGAGPLSHDGAHSRAVADLTVYLRQHHAERDLARLGELVAEHGVTW